MAFPLEILHRVADYSDSETSFILSRLIGVDDEAALHRALPCIIYDDIREAWRQAAHKKSLILFRALNLFYRNYFVHDVLHTSIRTDWLPGVQFILGEFDERQIKQEMWRWVRDYSLCILAPPSSVASWFFKSNPDYVSELEWRYLVRRRMPGFLARLLALCPSLKTPDLEWALWAREPDTARWIVENAPPADSLNVEFSDFMLDRLMRIKLLYASGVKLLFPTSTVVEAATAGDSKFIRWVYRRRWEFFKINWSQVYAKALEHEASYRQNNPGIALWLHKQGVLSKRNMRKDIQEKFKAVAPPSGPVAKHICEEFGVDYTGMNEVLRRPLTNLRWKFADIRWMMRRFNLKIPKDLADQIQSKHSFTDWSKAYLARRIE